MQFILPSYASLLNDPKLTIEHDGETIKWDISEFQPKSSFEKDDMHLHMFVPINAYWSKQPVALQKAIFEVFVKLRQAFDINFTAENQNISASDVTPLLNAQITPLLKQLYDYHPFSEMEYFVRHSSGLRIPGPEHLDAEFIENDDKNHTRNKTYTINDYVGLVTLILELRMMIPIWGEYIKRTGPTAGTKYKEFYSLELLANTAIAQSEPFVKLRLYIEERTPKDGNRTAMIDFVSSEDYPKWIMALLVVRRLCMADIRGAVDSSAVLVRHISRHVHERVNRTDTSFGGKINPKTDSTIRGSEENQISYLEGNKIKPKLSEGQIGTLRFYVRDPYDVAKRMDPTVPMQDVEKALASQNLVQKSDGIRAQMLMLQWMIAPVVPPAATDFFDIITVSKLLCVTQAVLWHNNHHLMAGLATAVAAPQIKGQVSAGETGSKGRLTKELQDELALLYPFQRRTRAGRPINQPVQGIDNLVTAFLAHSSWSLTLPPDKIEVLNPKNGHQKRIVLPHNFRMKVAELALYTVKRPRPTSLTQGV